MSDPVTSPDPPKELKVNKIQRAGKFKGHDLLVQGRNHLEPTEITAFLKASEDDYFWNSYFILQYWFGCRVSEPALILKEDVSKKEKLIIIRRLKKRGVAGYSEEVHHLSKTLRGCVDRLLEWNEKNGLMENPWLFPSPRKTKKIPKERLGQLRRQDEGWTSISRMSAHNAFKKYAQIANIPENLQHTHVLRHTRATLLLAQGHKVEHVQILLGHANPATTFKYIGVAESLRNKLQGVLEDGMEELAPFMVRTSVRRTAELSRSTESIKDSEFQGEEFIPDELDLDFEEG